LKTRPPISGSIVSPLGAGEASRPVQSQGHFHLRLDGYVADARVAEVNPQVEALVCFLPRGRTLIARGGQTVDVITGPGRQDQGDRRQYARCQPASAEHEVDQPAASPPVAVGERVNRLELGMGESSLCHGRQRIAVAEGAQICEQVPHKFRWRRHRTDAAWTLGTVTSILSNPRYAGRQVWNRQRTDRDLADPADVSPGIRACSGGTCPTGAPGHASIIVWDLYTDDGRYFFSQTEAGLPAQVKKNRVQARPTAMPGLRHDATPHIVPIYQLDISGRRFAVARLTRELR
jgi:hypothetical protein